MASAKWSIGLYQLIAHTKHLPETMADEAATIATESAKEGGNLMYDKVDRIDTEFMKGSVGNSDAVRRGNTISAEFGWGIEGAEVEPYFIYQERGFTHAGSGKWIPGMHALFEAFVESREKFYARVKALVN